MAGFRGTIARSLDETAPFRAFWGDRAGDSIVADPDFFAVAVESDPHAIRPHLLYVERDGKPHALVVARIETFKTGAKLGHRRVFSCRVRSITTVYNGCIGIVDEETAAFVLGEFRKCLQAGEADLITIRHLAPDSPLYRVATTRPSLLCRQHGAAPDLHWELALPATYDEYLRSRSKKVREGIKSSGRRFEREFGNRIAIRAYRRPEEIDEFFQQIDLVSPKTYQYGLGIAFKDSPRHRPQVEFRMSRGWYRAWVLSVDGTPIAFRQGDAYRGRLRLISPGYDPEFAHYGVGNYLLVHVIEELCADPDVDIIDFGLGDSESKRRFGSRSNPERDVVVYALTAKAIGINLMRWPLMQLNRLAKRLLKRTGLYEQIRRRSRVRATAPQTKQG